MISLVLTLAFVVFEAIAGFQAHSLALLSDAGHNFTDAFALLLAAFGIYLQARPGDHERTFGYQRAGVLAAFVNALTLVVLAFVLFYESYDRFVHPTQVATSTMMYVAAAAMLLNIGIAWALGGHGGHHHDLNLRAAWLHMVGDAISSAAIIAGAIAIRYTGWQAIDPILSVLIGIMIVWSGWGIIRDTLNILLEGAPKGLALSDVKAEVSQVPGVIDVHDLHIWAMSTTEVAMTVHLVMQAPPEDDEFLRHLGHELHERFGIDHTTTQFERGADCLQAPAHVV